MKRLFIWSILGMFFFSACQTKQEYFTQQQFRKKSDSLTAIRFMELEKQAAEDLDRRMAIEIKPKVDSILEKKPVVMQLLPAEKLNDVKAQPDSLVKDSL